MGAPCKGQKILKEATFKKWKKKFPWLKILSIGQQKKMICEICTNQEKKTFKSQHLQNIEVQIVISVHQRQKKMRKSLLQVNQYQCVKLL